jgi:putative salt-induced outer membrane protein YdiY
MLPSHFGVYEEKALKRLPGALGILLFATLARAEDASPAWSGEAGLSYVQTTGNSSNSTVGGAFKLVRDDSVWKLMLSSAFVRTESESVKTAERFDGALRGERGFGDRFAVYGQALYLRNVFAGVDGQETFESGGVFKLALGPKHFLSLSGALAYTAEQRLAPAADRNFVGGRSALAYKWQISPNADFTEDVDYLQSFKDGADGRLTNNAALTAKISKILALKLQHQLLYYHDPVPGKKTTDTTILASIVAKWPAPAPPPPPCPACPSN